MRGFLKMCALSAVLSVTLVTAYNQAWSSQPDPARGKLYQDRLSGAEPDPQHAIRPVASARVTPATGARKGDRLKATATCADQTWPYIPPACLASGRDGAAKPVRVITIEAREGANTSVLVRVPQAEIASR